MARGKKAAADAGPVEELWDLPSGWSWARLDDVAPVNPGRDLGGVDDNDEVTFLPMAAVAELSGKIDLSQRRPAGAVRSGFTRFRTGDVIFAKITPCMENGKLAIIPDVPHRVGAGSTEFHVLEPQQVSGRYLFYWLSQQTFRARAERNMRGAAGQRRVPADWLRSSPVPIPPNHTAQAEIVARIDALFAEIDEGEAALAEAQAGVETYRKALLKAAVTGELTADWRRQNPPRETGADLLNRILAERRAHWQADPKNARKTYAEPSGPDLDELPDLPEGWVWSSIGQLFKVGVGTTPSRANKSLWIGDLPWVSSGEVAFTRISRTNEMIDRDQIKPHRLCQPGTVLLGMIGEGKTRGQVALLEIEAHHNQNCASIHVYETPVPPEFVYFWLEHRYEITRASGSGGNQPALNKERVEAIPVPLPPAPELKALVTLLSEQLAVGDDAAGELAAVGSALDTLRQSILAVAFRGEC